jgi:flagellar protein FliO/FliZ
MSTFLMFGRTLLALGVVLGLVWGLSHLSRRAQGGTRNRMRSRSGNAAAQDLRVTVLTRRSLSRSSAIAVVRVGDRNLVIGTTPQNVTLLTELPLQEWELADDETTALNTTGAANDTPWKATSRQTPLAWDAVISTLRERTTRH